MSTEIPQVNLAVADAQKKSLTDVYRVKSAQYEYASDEYSARAGGAKPLQFSIEWEALTFRFADNPTTNPILKRSINVTGRDGAVMNWGDPANPEPTSDDSFPIQVSKYFAKCGTVIGTDPHVIDGHVYRCERATLRAGKSEVTTLVPLERLADDFSVPEADIRIVQAKETGQAGNPTGATPAAPAGPTKDAAYKALAAAMNGKNQTDLVSIALSDSVASQQSDVLSEVAAGGAVEALKAFGSFDDSGVFTAAA